VISPADLLQQARVVLFDIDGTLLRYGNGIHGRAIIQACDERTGADIGQHFGRISAGGRTDRYIVNELLRLSGMGQNDIDAMFDDIVQRSTELTEAGLRDPNPDWVLPGSHEVVGALTALQIPVGLVTGNLPRIAELKLDCARIWDPFASQQPLISGFGHLSEDRNDLSRAALQQARREIDAAIDGDHLVIVGDTPRDVECAHAIGASCLAVTTGRFTADDLRAAGAVHVVETLEGVAG
jgi:phosphoglycolate phosphatase